MVGAARMLAGATLPNGWKVVQEVTRSKSATGGHFSSSYIAENADGRRAFLKAMDYSGAFAPGVDTPAMLQLMTSSYLFERRVCEKCGTDRLRRVVHAIDAFSVDAVEGQPFSKVECLVFERAEGDIRAHLDAADSFDIAFTFRMLHQVATGLEQMHRADMAHQDLKPSNVLVFSGTAGVKIGDLGRAWSQHHQAPHDDLQVAGDMGYAPPELLYGEVPATVPARRFGCDNYHLGSLIVFMFSRVHMTSLVVKYLDHAHRPSWWRGEYAEALPYVQSAFLDAVSEFAPQVPGRYREAVTRMVTQLCEPDPTRRGHPSNGRVNAGQFSLDRYISELDLLARDAGLRLVTGGA